MNEIQAVCVFCASSQSVDELFKHTALEVGRELGKKGIELVYGGASIGLMGCLARGVHEEKGRVIGVLPEFFAVMALRRPVYFGSVLHLYSRYSQWKLFTLRTKFEADKVSHAIKLK